MKMIFNTRIINFFGSIIFLLAGLAEAQPYQKYVRTICYFSDRPSIKDINKLNFLKSQLEEQGFTVQTLRLVSKQKSIKALEEAIHDESIILGIGTISFKDALDSRKSFYKSRISMNVDLTNEKINMNHVDFLLDMMIKSPDKMFDFAYVFNNADNTPFFPAANYNKKGFAIGLQPTNLAEGASTIDEWLNRKKSVWEEINTIFKRDRYFLGIDASTAPLHRGSGSLVGFIKKLGYDFSKSTTTDLWTKITHFIKDENLNSIGLNGLMLPCLEDFELADEYERGNFSIERNLFLSLQSGLGIDTYPIGIDEDTKRILNILKSVQSLSNKYNKSLSVRFVSDGKAKIGEITDFDNQYLKDVVVRPL